MGEFAGFVVPRTRYLTSTFLKSSYGPVGGRYGPACGVQSTGAVRDGVGRGTPVPREKRAAKLWKPLLSSPEKAAV